MDSWVGIELGPVRAQFPFWIDHLPAGEKKAAFRWLVDLNLRALAPF